MNSNQEVEPTIHEFERTGQKLTHIMVALCEKRYAVSKNSQFHHANAMAKSSIAVIEAIKTFAAVANFPENK